MSQTIWPAGITPSKRELRLRDQALGLLVDVDLGEQVLVADAAARIAVLGVDELLQRRLAVAGHVCRAPARRGDQLAVDHEQAVVLALDVCLDDHRLVAPVGRLVAVLQRRVVVDVGAHAAAVVAHERLGRDGIADPLRGLERLLERGYGLALRHGDARVAEDLLGPLLVVGDAVADQARLPRDRGLEALLLVAVTELDVAALLAQALVGDVARLGGVDDRRGRRAQHVGVTHLLEARDDRVEIDLFLVEQALDQLDGLAPRREAAGLVTVAVADVVDAGLVRVDGLAVADGEPDQVLQLDRDVLDDVPRPGAALDPLEEAAGPAHRAAMIMQRRDQLLEALDDAWDGVARLVLELPDVEAHVDGEVAAVVVRPPQGAVLENLHSRSSTPARRSSGPR
ncbi:MAG: hypothetical protein U5K43_05785 [Halofilum sp. (in: g-proteobacteria)]|nr:hypothetical protein [Halofilum sp. (in: g-proteobacteria)]